MPYAVEADLDLVWGSDLVSLMARDPETGTRNSLMIAEACNGASAIVDGYLARRYPLPLVLGADGNAVLRQIAADIALWRLASVSADKMTEAVSKRYDEAKGFLERVADGKSAIPMPAPDVPAGSAAATAASDPDASPNEVRLFAQDRMFTRDRLRGL